MDSIMFFENIGDSYYHQFIYEGEVEGIDLSGYSIPKLIDIDNDLDLDLFIGSMNGQIAFYENSGTVNTFNFSFIT